MRREYDIEPLTINGRIIRKLAIDPHVDKHADHIDDELVKNIITLLDGGDFSPVKIDDGFSYFANTLKYQENWYKIIWLLEDESFYIGVITVFKDRRIKR